jgi:hypothetical protein
MGIITVVRIKGIDGVILIAIGIKIILEHLA